MNLDALQARAREIADRYDVDLAGDFARMTGGVDRHLDGPAAEG